MDITDALVGEHGVLHLLVAQVEDAVGRWQTLPELRAACEPLAVSLLAHHRAEEETLLVPYEQQQGDLGPLKCLRHEHQIMNQLTQRLFHTDDLDETKRRLLELVGVVQRHLKREEELLFATVRKTLPDDTRTHLGQHWAAFRGVVLPR
jgi:hemerythrin-like domain-containing protein